jgi:hypothetical protein
MRSPAHNHPMQYPLPLAQAFTFILSALTAFGEAQKISDSMCGLFKKQ